MARKSNDQSPGIGVIYETIGRTYAKTRREDARIAAQIHDALGDARTIVNVGAGSGNYEPRDRVVVSIEPATAMIRQRQHDAARCVRGVAEHLPFADNTFDAALGVLTIHHWRDLARGLGEMRRVSRRQVIFLFEPTMTRLFWAVDYFPEAIGAWSEVHAPGVDAIGRHLDVRDVQVVAVPKDCRDGFGAAYWARPEKYLEPDVQAGMSWMAQLSEDVLAKGSAALAADLASGEWRRKHGHLLDRDEADFGYRIVVAGG